MSELYSAFVLGVVEGLTEFLPVSSTGHLILVGDLLPVRGNRQEFFDVFIQLGAILAVAILYRRRFLELLQFGGVSESGGGMRGFEGLLKLFLACLPAFVAGALFHGVIKEKLFSPFTVAAALVAGALLMLAAERHVRRSEINDLGEIRVRDAFLIGVWQCLALWPGMSRSACTIVGGLFSGLERSVAAEFSFLVAVPVMFAAVGYDLIGNWAYLSMADVPFYGVGFAVSFLTAIPAIRIFLVLLNRFTLVPFAWYRIILGIMVLAYMAG